LSANVDLAFVWLVQPGEDRHEDGLAGPVLAHQRMDLPGTHLQVYPVIGDDSREPFGDLAHLDFETHGHSWDLCAGSGGRMGGVLTPEIAYSAAETAGSSSSMSPSMICCFTSLRVSTRSGWSITVHSLSAASSVRLTISMPPSARP